MHSSPVQIPSPINKLWSVHCRRFTCTICVPSPRSIRLRHRWVYWVELAYKSNSTHIICSMELILLPHLLRNLLEICEQKSNVLAVILKAEIKSWDRDKIQFSILLFTRTALLSWNIMSMNGCRKSFSLKEFLDKRHTRHLETQNNLHADLHYYLI